MELASHARDRCGVRRDGITTYNNGAFAPAACPLPTNARDPTLPTRRARADVQFRLNLDTDAEVQVHGRRGESKGASSVVLIELVPQVIGRDLILQNVLITWASQEVLPLARRVLGTDLIAVDAPGGEALVVFIGAELNKGGVDIPQRDLRHVGGGRLSLLPLGGRSAVASQRHTALTGRAVDAGVRHEGQGSMLAHGAVVGVGTVGGRIAGRLARHGGVGLGLGLGSLGTGGRRSARDLESDVRVCLEVGRTLKKMLFLTRRVLGPGLLAVDTLHTQAFRAGIWLWRSSHISRPAGVGVREQWLWVWVWVWAWAEMEMGMGREGMGMRMGMGYMTEQNTVTVTAIRIQRVRLQRVQQSSSLQDRG